ncbi:sensor histidine kinase [uncultured Algibacter sp.]|uniref:tetratricopeptide repeat-containing sensor histidine kinase n=1 Tax=uncultured Algibacter sp. TaxID=298659 RepID=UPI002614A6FE|nr:sensor histidine kinase [uncultured Algibacter sp.]
MKHKFFILLLLFSSVCFSQEKTNIVIDSINLYLSNVNKKADNDFESSLVNLLRAKELSEEYNIDSLIIKSNIALSSFYLDNGNDKLFLSYGHSGLKLANKINDSTLLALINKNLGYYYYDKSIDSAYYYNNNAEKLYRGLKDNYNRAVVLLDIALLQKNDKDYTGSELTSINGLTLLDKLYESENVKRYKSYFYNNLAILFKELSQFDESIDYNLKALNLLSQLQGENNALIDGQKNNLANVYNSSEQYTLANDYYLQILENKNLINERPGFYALVLDNYAYNLFLSNKNSQLPNLFLKALKICESIGDDYKSIVINQHLAEYYNHIKQKDSAKYYAYRAKEIAEPNFTDDLLESLLVLSKIEDDSIAVKYYDAYIKLNDSIIKNERSIRNKFTRIQYETAKIEEENIQIARERLWLLIISIVLIIASFLIYVIINQRNKNKELQFVQKQQEANEEIYNLMLSQNESIEEARTLEKQRISQELHDGVLGRLFGTRLSLDSLNMNPSPEAIKTRGQYIDELKTIEQDIRKVSHELNTDFVSGSGFIDIIKTLIETQTNAYKLEYKIDYAETINWDNVSNKKKIHIYRLLQESLHNIYKHANATYVKISFKLKNNVICLIIEDNGSGFDANKAKSGIGLKNMNARIKEINGKIEITSEKQKGTQVSIEVPIL